MSIASLPGVEITSEICLLTATLTDKGNPSSNSQETFLKGGRFVLGWLVGVSALHVYSISKSHNENTNIKCNTPDSMWPSPSEALVVRCQYCLISTLGLYVNTLEYTELLNRLIFDRVYGS